MPLYIFYPLLLPILWFVPKLRHIVIVLLLGFYAIYDLIDYSTIYYGVSPLTKVLPEILLVGFILFFLLQKMRHKRQYNIRNFLFFAALVLLVLALIPWHEVPFMEEIHEVRIIFRSMFFFILIIETCNFNNRQFQFIIQSFLFLSVIICVVGIYQYYTFEGDYTAVWRYEPMLNAKLEKNEYFLVRFMKYQIVRNDHLRASGSFYSALDFGFLAGVFAVSCYVYFRNTCDSFKRILFFIGMLVGLWACYVSGVRTSFVLFVFGVVCNTVITNEIIVKPRNYILSLIGLSLLIFLLIGLFQVYLDTSSIGRLNQLYKVFSSFLPLGHGLSVARFDSAFLYYVNGMGLLSIPLIVFTFRVFIPNILFNKDVSNVDSKMLYITGLGIVFIMFFQFAIGGFVYNSILLLTASYITINKYDARSK